MSDSSYLNFDLEIERTSVGYRAQVLSSPSGEASAEFDSAALQQIVLEASAQIIGGQLFDAVFRGEVLSCLRRSLDEATRSNQGLRIRLRLSESPELINLPWEYLYDHTRDQFLALSRETPLVRYLDLPEPARGLEPGPRLRVLAVIASPTGLPPLDVEREWANLQAALGGLETAGVVTLERLQPASARALQEQLLRQEYHILHFVGHGAFDPTAKEGVILLAAEDGAPEPVSGQYLSALLHDHRSLRLAVLNACQGAEALSEDPYAGVAQKLVRGGIPAVIAMRTAISDEAGITLARSFYGALASGIAVDAALAEARKTLFASGNQAEWGTPALYMRAPDGNLWPRPSSNQVEERRKIGRLAALVALAIVLLLGVSFAAYNVIGPTQMDPRSTMNLAVVDVGTLDNSGQIQPAEDGALLREWIVSGLGEANGRLPVGSRVAIWHNGLPRTEKRPTLGVVKGKTAEERAIVAGALAEKIAADVIIYGHIEQADDGRQFVLEFYVSPRLRPEANETIGRYQLGESIPLPNDLRNADTLAREAAAGSVTVRAQGLFSLILGLREDILGRHESALALLRQAETELKSWRERGEGKEILHYFIARQALYLKQYEEAVAAAQQSLASNPQYPRAYIVLGGAHLQQAQEQPATERLAAGGLLEQAEKEQTQAVDLAVQARDTRMEIITRLSLAAVHIAQGIAHYDLDSEAGDVEALRRLDQAVIEVRPLLAPLEEIKQYRLLAQTYSYIGAAHLEQGSLNDRRGDRKRAVVFFQQANEALQSCIDQGKQTPEDQTLNQKLIAEICKPYQEIARAALQKLGE